VEEQEHGREEDHGSRRANVKDFISGTLGIRVYDDYCTVIVKKPGVNGWLEDGQRFPLPLPEGFDSLVTIPAGRLALTVRTYELAHPGSALRELLMRSPVPPNES
jgi:hypothetical protein